jgi:hypothetical protein
MQLGQHTRRKITKVMERGFFFESQLHKQVTGRDACAANGHNCVGIKVTPLIGSLSKRISSLMQCKNKDKQCWVHDDVVMLTYPYWKVV